MEGQEPPISPTVSPMKELTTTAAVAMETEGDTLEDKATDSPVDDKTMQDATQENTQENNAAAASKATETEETNLEIEKMTRRRSWRKQVKWRWSKAWLLKGGTPKVMTTWTT